MVCYETLNDQSKSLSITIFMRIRKQRTVLMLLSLSWKNISCKVSELTRKFIQLKINKYIYYIEYFKEK